MAEASTVSFNGVSPDGTDTSGKPAGFTAILGAVLSLALVLGLGIWGYKLAVRDVSGIPVVRAIDGPMRVQPDDPGGESAAFQGYSVNDVQADGGAAAPADRLALAPNTVGLTDEDIPASSDVTVAAAPVQDAPLEAVSDTDTVADLAQTPDDAPDAIPANADVDMLALADQLTDGVAPLSETLTDITPTSADATQTTQEAANNAVAAALLEPQLVSAALPGVAHSPRPLARPAGLVQVAATQTPPASADVTDAIGALPATVEIAAADIVAGTRLVQLGAFESAEVARAEWDKLLVRFEDYFVGKQRVVQEATSGGKTFFRLRANGFTGVTDSRRFCAVLMNANVACIPVTTR